MYSQGNISIIHKHQNNISNHNCSLIFYYILIFLPETKVYYTVSAKQYNVCPIGSIIFNVFCPWLCFFIQNRLYMCQYNNLIKSHLSLVPVYWYIFFCMSWRGLYMCQCNNLIISHLSLVPVYWYVVTWAVHVPV